MAPVHDQPPTDRIAGTLIVVACAYTSLSVCERFGLLDRERHLYRRLWPAFDRVVYVSYGDAADHAIAASLVPEMLGRVWCVCNDRNLEPGIFLSEVPERVRRLCESDGSALVLTDQFWGGDVAVSIARALRHDRRRTGLVARGGYHWSWTMLREHGPDSRPFAQARFLEGELLRAADVIISTTPRILDDLAFQHAIPRDRLRLVPNFVLTDQPPTPLSRREPGLILTAGRLAREKRIHLLIEAVGRLSPELRTSARLLIVGEGPESSALTNLAARLNIRAEFRPRIPHSELLALMGRCRIYAQCSEYEGHPKTVLEAMAMASPVLVTRAPGLSDRITHQHTGLIAQPAPDHLAAALQQLLTDDALAAQLGAAAATEVRTVLGFDTVFPHYRQACADAMTIAGAGRSLPPPVIRWDQPLLTLHPDAAAAEWMAGIHAYAKRLSTGSRDAFAASLMARLESLSAPAATDTILTDAPTA